VLASDIKTVAGLRFTGEQGKEANKGLMRERRKPVVFQNVVVNGQPLSLEQVKTNAFVRRITVRR